MKTAPANSNVVILPVIRIERGSFVPVRGQVSPHAQDMLQRLAAEKFSGDLFACVSFLLEQCADAYAAEEGRQ